MSDIRLLTLNDQSVLEDFFRRYPAEVSEMTFTNLFVWRKSRPVYFTEVADSLVFMVASETGDKPRKLVFGPPLGPASPMEVAALLDGEIFGFVRIPKETAETLRGGGFEVTPDRDNADYVYRVKDLAELKGRQFHKKRNLIKQCLEKYPCVYEPVTAELIAECSEMQDRWCAARQCGHDPGLCTEYVAVMETLGHWEHFPLLGGAIRIDGALQAFAVGERLGPQTAVCHFEKAMPGYRGLGQLINQWFAKYALQGFEFENREQDLGVPGLRQAKQSYYPDHLVDKFRAWLPGTPPAAVSPLEPHECGKHEKEEESR